MTAREHILGDIRRALGRAAGQPPRMEAAPLSAPVMRIPRSDRNLYTDLFVQKLENLAGKGICVRDTAAVIPAITELLAQKHAVASNSPFLRKCGITGLAQVHTGFTDREQLKEACAAADVGITSVDYALAATGSFVMISSASEARLVSLLPPVHVAIFPRSRILANLDELLSILPRPADQTSSMVLITGPSRTADIEQILVRGVHGPGEVYAVIVDEE
ncbi:MAG TPA: lactate utilization protein [Bryobacteraceae bacterium]|nr:lactate utilization protein [Bryobacteraceae bacterium]